MTDKEKLIKIKSLADKMYYAAFNMTTDASLLRKAMKEYRQFIIHEYCKEEPVSDDLEEEIDNYIKWNGYDGLDSREEVKYIANHFAKWQKDRIMLNTIYATCFGFQGAALFSFRLPAGSYLVGSKVKVIIIKED